jgi:hypothetical protein
MIFKPCTSRNSLCDHFTSIRNEVPIWQRESFPNPQLVQLKAIGVINMNTIWGVLLMDPTRLSEHIGTEFEQLSAVERMVHDALTRSRSEYHDIYQIAKECKLTELQVMVSIQLLIHKKLLPIVNNEN